MIAGGLFFYFYYGAYKLLYVNFAVLGQDFMHGYFAAENFFAGRSIYIMPQLFTAYPYFPPVTFIFMPFLKFAEAEARLLWLLLGHVLTGIACWKIYRFGSGRSKTLSAASAAAVVLFSTPLYQMLQTGNINIFIFFGLSLVYAGLLSGRSGLVPPLLAVFFFIKVFPALLMGVFLRRRNCAAFGYFALTLAVLAAVSVAVFGVRDSLFYFRQLPVITQYPGIIHAMSFTYFFKLFWPQADALALFFPNLGFLIALAAIWWRVSGKQPERAGGPGAAAADLFVLTVIMTLVVPSSWTIYCALYAIPFYFVVFSLLEGRHDFKFSLVFVLVLLFFNFWENIYYHLPLSSGYLTARAVELDKSLHPVLFPLIFSMHFVANLALFGWILANYRELAAGMERIGAASRPPKAAIPA